MRLFPDTSAVVEVVIMAAFFRRDLPMKPSPSMRLPHRLPWLFVIALGMSGIAQAEQPQAWSQPRQPFHLFGNTWYVGTQGLSAILITSPGGHVLIDGTLARNAAQIEANIRALGFRLRDVRVILNSHAHGDHAGAIAHLARDSGAQVWASANGARALMAGGDDPDDPQYGSIGGYPAVARVAVVKDGDSVRAGGITITAHYTPGHTPGSTSWTWTSCEGSRCRAMVYADSLTAVSNAHYRFSDDASHPHRVEDFRQSMATVATLPCDVLLTPHPDASGFIERIDRRGQGTVAGALIDTQACKNYAVDARKRFDARLRQEAGAPH
jgi:metallo-beta-lactamase class B